MPERPQDDVLRTPDHQFEHLPGYPFEPRYAEVHTDGFAPLRMHYV